MNKKITSSVLAALMVAGSTSFTAFAAMPNGTVVIGSKAFDLVYANDPANASVIGAALLAGGEVYVKDFGGQWIDNATGLAIAATIIPAVTYTNAAGTTNYNPGDANVTATVGTIAAIPAVTAAVGTTANNLGLPTTVGVTLSDATTDFASITWDTTAFDGTKVGTVIVNGTLSVPAGKTWTLTAAQKAVSVAVTVGAAKITAASVSAINNSTVQISGIPTSVTEASIAAKKITLTSGDVTLTGTYVLASLTSTGKANFLLDASKKLTDASTYVVSSDWAEFTTNSFVAKVVSAYTNTFDKITTSVSAGTTSSLYFTAKNQYNEVINTANLANVKTTVTVNGMPLTATTEYTVSASGEKVVVAILRLTKENDIVSVKFDTYDQAPLATDAKVIATSSATYTVLKASTTGAVPTTITSVAGTYANAVNDHKLGDPATEVLPTDSIKLTADVRDQYNNPVTSVSTGNLIRWVVTSGSDCLVADITGDTNVNTVLFTAAKAGIVTIDAYNIANGTKSTYTVTIGASKLSAITAVSESASTTYNQEDIIAQRISANSGAVLAPEMIKYNVVSKTTGVVASDVTITTSVRAKDDTTDSSKKKGDVLVTVNSLKSGTFEITPFVGTSFTDTNAIKAGMFTVATTANPKVTSVDPIAVPALKVATTTKVGVVARNTHGEVVTLASSAVNVQIYKDGAVSSALTVSQLDSLGAATTTNVKQLGLLASAAGNYVVRVSLVGSTTFYDIPVVAEKTVLTTIDAGVDITSGVIAGQINGVNADATYKVVAVKDNKGDLITPDLGTAKGQLSATIAKQSGDVDTFVLPTVGLVYYKTVSGKLTETTVKADAEGIALKIDANLATTPVNVDKNVAVTITNNGLTSDATLVTGSLNVIVKQARVLKVLDAKETALYVGLNGTATVDVSTKDQYGDFFAVNPTTDLTFVSSDASIANESAYVGMVDIKGVATTDVTKAVAYRFNVAGYKSGTVNLDVKSGTTLKDTVSVNVAPASSLVSSIQLVNSKLNADGTYGYKVPNNSANAATFTVKALNASGNVVSINSADIVWTSSNSTVATVVNGVVSTVTSRTATADTNVTITADVFGVKQSVVLNVAKDAAALVDGTTALTKAGTVTDLTKIDADATTAGIQIALDGKVTDGENADGTITLTFAGKDQFGNATSITALPDAAISYNTEVAKVGLSGDTITITPVSVGATKVRLTVGTQDITVDVNIADKAVVEQAAKNIAAISSIAAVVDVTTDGSTITSTIKTGLGETTLDSIATISNLVSANLVPTSVTINGVQYTDVLNNVNEIKAAIVTLTGATDFAHVTLSQLVNKPISITANGTTINLAVK
ncbi:MAG TPA: Ig-like domain-containing protein [Clostridium sp.]|uniref:beta strand repeat-containing protein n=1 Tax=Clostridium sp. TaxID=1506 RepID=UPI002F949ACE